MFVRSSAHLLATYLACKGDACTMLYSSTYGEDERSICVHACALPLPTESRLRGRAERAIEELRDALVDFHRRLELPRDEQLGLQRQCLSRLFRLQGAQRVLHHRQLNECLVKILHVVGVDVLDVVERSGVLPELVQDGDRISRSIYEHQNVSHGLLELLRFG